MSFMVPVVFGPHPDDVKKLAPPNSYIHVENYKNPRDLIEYLNYLNQNDTAYMQYHQWRVTTPFGISKPPESFGHKKFCGVCRLLKEKQDNYFPIKRIRSITAWWWLNTHDDRCINGSHIPEYLEKFLDNKSKIFIP